MDYHIRFTEGPLLGKKYKIGVTPVKIGRDDPESKCGIRIASIYVSLMHVRLQVVNDTVEMKVYSKKTTKIDGRLVEKREEPYLLHDGSEVNLNTGAAFVVEQVVHKKNVNENPPNVNDKGKEIPAASTKTSSAPPTPKSTEMPQKEANTPPPSDAPQVQTKPILWWKRRFANIWSKKSEKKGPNTGQGSDSTLPPTEFQPNTTNTQQGQNKQDETVIKDPKIIEEMLAQDERNAKQRMACLIVGLFVLFICLCIMSYFTYKEPEKKLTWKNGPNSTKEFILPKLKYKVTLSYPNCKQAAPSMKEDKDQTIVWVDTYAGQDNDVPCRISVEYSYDNSILFCSRKKAFERWRKNKSINDSSWNFEEILPLKVSSIKKNITSNGIPFLSSFYTRKRGKIKVFGFVCYYRQGNMQISVYVDMPNEERWRGEHFLNYKFINFSEEAAENHWEGDETLITGSVEELLSKAQQYLDYNTFQYWNEIESCLQAALVNSHKQNQTQFHEKALELLTMLRRNKKEIYSDYLVKFRQKTSDEERKLIQEDCKAIFNSPEDRRYYDVREEKWGKY